MGDGNRMYECVWVGASSVCDFKGKVFIESWFDGGLPEDWRFEVSPNGWTSDEIGLRWLEKLFYSYYFFSYKGA